MILVSSPQVSSPALQYKRETIPSCGVVSLGDPDSPYRLTLFVSGGHIPINDHVDLSLINQIHRRAWIAFLANCNYSGEILTHGLSFANSPRDILSQIFACPVWDDLENPDLLEPLGNELQIYNIPLRGLLHAGVEDSAEGLGSENRKLFLVSLADPLWNVILFLLFVLQEVLRNVLQHFLFLWVRPRLLHCIL
jgi:hypothetical protein